MLLLACACRSSPLPPEPKREAPNPPESTDAGFVSSQKILALAERLEAELDFDSNGPLPTSIEVGQASGEGGMTELRIGGELIFELSGSGDDCPATLGVPLLVFEGPEAFLLTGAIVPTIVTLTRASEQPRCWYLPEFPCLPESSTPLLSLDLVTGSLDSEEPVEAQHADLELLADHPGAERVELLPTDDGPQLRITTTAGVILAHWEAMYACEYDDSITVDVHRLAPGYMLVLSRDCDDCAPCEHARATSRSHIELWWQPGPSALEARATHETSEAHDSWLESGDIAVVAEDVVTESVSWPFGTGTITHELSTVVAETTETNGDDSESSRSETQLERWMVESPSGVRVIRFRPPER
jgi:hypothetical protein